VRFGLDGYSYEIDLSTKNANKLRNALSVYLDNGTRLSGRASSGMSRSVGRARGGAVPSASRTRQSGRGLRGKAMTWRRAGESSRRSSTITTARPVAEIRDADTSRKHHLQIAQLAEAIAAESVLAPQRCVCRPRLTEPEPRGTSSESAPSRETLCSLRRCSLILPALSSSGVRGPDYALRVLDDHSLCPDARSDAPTPVLPAPDAIFGANEPRPGRRRRSTRGCTPRRGVGRRRYSWGSKAKPPAHGATGSGGATRRHTALQ
jgi:hypothetical protein